MPSKSAILAGAAYVKLTLDSAEMANGMKQAQTRFKSFANDIKAWSSQMSSIGAIAQLPLSDALNTFNEFETRMRYVQAVTKSTGNAFRQLTKQARQLGRDTSFTSNEVADAMLNLGRMGFTAREIEKSVPHVMNLARATGTDFAVAAEVAANQIRVFGLNASDAMSIADKFTVVANSSAQTLPDLAEAASKAGPKFYSAGEDIDTMVASLGVLANMGIKGSLAGTGLGRAVTRLANVDVQKTLRDVYNIETIRDGELKPFYENLKQILTVSQSLKRFERLNLFEEVFGERGLYAALPLVTNLQDFDAMLEKVKNSAGTAETAAKKIEGGIYGVIERLKSAVADLKIEFGSTLFDSFSSSIVSLTEFLKKITEFVSKNSLIIGSVVKLASAFTALGVAIKSAYLVGGVAKSVYTPFARIDSLLSASGKGGSISSYAKSSDLSRYNGMLDAQRSSASLVSRLSPIANNAAANTVNAQNAFNATSASLLAAQGLKSGKIEDTQMAALRQRLASQSQSLKNDIALAKKGVRYANGLVKIQQNRVNATKESIALLKAQRDTDVKILAAKKKELQEQLKKAKLAEKNANRNLANAQKNYADVSRRIAAERKSLVAQYGPDVFYSQKRKNLLASMPLNRLGAGISAGYIAMTKQQYNLNRLFGKANGGMSFANLLGASFSPKHSGSILNFKTKDIALMRSVADGGKRVAATYYAQAAAAKVAAGATSMLSTAWAWILAHPLTATIAAAATVFEVLAAKAEKAKQKIKDLINAEQKEANDAARQREENANKATTASSWIERLSALNEKEITNPRDIENVKNVIDKLNDTFQDLGVTFDNDKKKIIGLESALKKIKEDTDKLDVDLKNTQNENTIASIQDQARLLRENVDKIVFKGSDRAQQQMFHGFINEIGFVENTEKKKIIVDFDFDENDQYNPIYKELEIGTGKYRFDTENFLENPQYFLNKILEIEKIVSRSGFSDIASGFSQIYDSLLELKENNDKVAESSKSVEESFNELGKSTTDLQEELKKQVSAYKERKEFEKDYNKFSDASAKYILEQEKKSFDSYLSRLNPFQMLNAINPEMRSNAMTLNSLQDEYRKMVESAKKNGFYKSFEDGGMNDLQKLQTGDFLADLANRIEEKTARQEELDGMMRDAFQNYERKITTAGNFSASALSSSLSSDQQYRNSVRQYLQNILASVNASRIAQQKTATNTNGISTLGTVQ